MVDRFYALLRRNRYTTTLVTVAMCFFVANCADCFLVICSSKDCINEITGLLLASDPIPGTSPITFERNIGQVDGSYDFLSHTGRTTLLLNSHEATVDVRGPRNQPGARIRATLVGSRTMPAEGLDPVTERTNYLIGNQPERWITDVPNFRRVRFSNVYPGIDIVYYGTGNQLEHDFVVSPGADPARIALAFSGAETVQLDSEGALELSSQGATLKWKKPVLYQTGADGRRRAIEGRYRMDGPNNVRFEVGAYDVTRHLTIDPVLTYSTYYGKGDAESAARVAVDASGNAYFTGGTGDVNFPVTPGAPAGKSDSAFFGDAIVVKMSADGKSVLYTTHIGGANTDIGLGIAVDGSGNVYIAGLTNSTDFPTAPAKAIMPAAPAATGQNAGDCFVAKLNSAGNALVYGTYLGGTGRDLCTGIAVDSAGNAYVTGSTSSKDFRTANAIEASLHGPSSSFTMDAFVSKISPDGTQLLYSTYIGGSGNDSGFAIAVDSTGNAYVTGGTTSADLVTTTGVVQKTYAGAGGQRITDFATGDAFVLKLAPDGKRTYCTYLGGSSDDLGIGIAIDAQGNAYVVGSTLSTNFPTKTPYQKAFAGAGGEVNYISGDGFIAKLDATASTILYASYLGGSKDDRASGVAVDSFGNAFVTGNTLSPDFPLAGASRQTKYGGEGKDVFRTGDAFFAQFDPVGTLAYSTFLGGAGTDWGVGVAVDAQGAVVVTGGTSSNDFATTAGVAQANYGGTDSQLLPAGDAFIIKFGAVPGVSLGGVVNAASYSGGGVAPGEIVTLGGVGIGPDTLAGLKLDSNNRVATVVANTRILFDDVPAPIIYVSARQSAAVVPYGIEGHATTSVVVEYNGVKSAPLIVPVVAAKPALFTADSSGSGQGAILNQDYKYNSAAIPAPRGSYVSLYGTGEGQTTPGGIDGSVAGSVLPKPTQTVKVTLGTKTLDPPLPYAGAAPSSVAGLFQINIRIPCDAPLGNVPVVVEIGGVKSQAGVTVAISDDPACTP